jgi:anti-sigma factor RsiW
MRCERVDPLLPAYLDGDLPSHLNQRISDHLDSCERCRRELAAQQCALRTLDSGRHPVSIDLWADFSRRLQAQRPPASSPWCVLRKPGPAGVMAAVMAMLIVVTAGKHLLIATTAAHSSITRLATRSQEGADPTADSRQAPVRANAVAAVAAAPPLWITPPHSSSTQRAAGLRARPVRRAPGAALARHLRRQWSKRPDLRPRRVAPPRRPVILADRPQPLTPPRWAIPERSAPTAAPAQPSAPVLVASYDTYPRTAQHSVSARGSRPTPAGDPIKIANAFFSAGEGAETDLMGCELRNMVHAVAQVRGEAADGSRPGGPAGDLIPADDPAAAFTHSSGS